MTLADKIAVMKDGEVRQFGSPQQIYDSPADLYVAGFIGSPAMNFIPCELAEDAGRAVVALDSGDGNKQRIVLGAISDTQRAYVGKPVVLGVRPEQLTDTSSAHSERDDLQTLTATVAITEPTGPDTLVTVTLNGTKTVARCHPRAAGSPGEQVKLMLDPGKALLFDPATEKRLA